MTAPQVPPCVGLWWLFDSTEQADHRRAADLCATCPRLDACRNQLAAELDMSHTMRAAGGGPRGTWAGELVGKPHRMLPKPREHATDRGYFQHRYYREAVCDECRIAHRLAERARAARAS